MMSYCAKSSVNIQGMIVIIEIRACISSITMQRSKVLAHRCFVLMNTCVCSVMYGVQEKADLHQHAQDLELQLERAQRGREGYTDQVCELSNQLAEAKAQTNRQGQETVQMKQDLLTVTEV